MIATSTLVVRSQDSAGLSRRFAGEKPRLAQAAEQAAMRAVGRCAAAANRLLGRREGRPLGIVTYHRVSPRIAGLPFPLHNVTPGAFRRQIEGLLERGFRPVALREAVLAQKNDSAIDDRSFAVTFDDGFETVFTRAWPVLRQLCVPATIFVNTAYLNGNTPFPFDAWGVAHQDRAHAESYRPLTTEQCREMADSGLIELGAHTHTHEDYRDRAGAFGEDLAVNVEMLREQFGVDRPTFSFPWGGTHNGFAGDELADAARAAGVVCGLTTEPDAVDPAGDPFRWGRFNAFAWDTPATLAAKLDGWYAWAPRFRKQLASFLRDEKT